MCDGTTEVAVPMAQWDSASATECSNGIDEDGNNFEDCADFGCQINPNVDVCPESNDADCSDGVDNADTDDFIDCEDFSCNRNPYVTVCGELELDYTTCSDGVDNDGNGFADCNDFSCENTAACL